MAAYSRAADKAGLADAKRIIRLPQPITISDASLDMADSVLRLSHARRRASELLEMVSPWLIGHCSTQVDVATDRKSIALRIEFDVDPPSEYWGLLLGEVLHHYRSGLDNSVYLSAARCAGKEPSSPWALRFPISSDAKHFESKASVWLGEAYTTIVEHVRAFQPFGVGEGEAFLQPGDALRGNHPLSLLQELNNSDKHRRWALLPPTLQQIELGSPDGPFQIEFEDLDGVPDEEIFNSIEFIEEIDPSGTFLRVGCNHSVKQVQLHGQINVAFAVPTENGPVSLEALLGGLDLICGLIMLRLDDTDCDIDVIWQRLAQIPPYERS